MAASEAVVAAADANTAIDDDTINPTVVNTGRHVVHVTLVFDGVDFVPNDIYDALDAEWGTVDSLRGTQARGTYEFRISA